MDKGESSKPSHDIPGPAGRVQEAIRKRARGKKVTNEGNDEESGDVEVPTQEYIARALLEPEFDDSFTKLTWETVRSFGYIDMECYSPMKTIKADLMYNQHMRIPLAVGNVSNYKPNGLGDAMMELKDETDNMSASISRKVLSDANFVGHIGVGAVLVLGDIVACKLGKYSYLNITNKNVKLVISKDGDVLQTAETVDPPHDF